MGEVTSAVDFTLEEVINRVRQASIIDDEEVDRDKANKNVFSVENFREALAEEFAETGVEEAEQKAQSHGGFEDKTVEDVVKLVRLPDGPINWALFTPSEIYRKGSRPSMIRRPSAFGLESSPL